MTVSTTATTQAKNTLASIDKIKAGCVATIAAHNTPTEIVKCITGFSRLENCAYISKVVAANKFKMAANEQGYFMVTEQGYKDLDDKTGRKVEDLYNTIDTPKKMKWGSFKQYLTAYNRLKRRVDDGGGGGGEDMTDEYYNQVINERAAFNQAEAERLAKIDEELRKVGPMYGFDANFVSAPSQYYQLQGKNTTNFQPTDQQLAGVN